MCKFEVGRVLGGELAGKLGHQVLATAEEMPGGAMHWEERNCADSGQPLRLPTVAANGPVRPHRQKHPQAENMILSQ